MMATEDIVNTLNKDEGGQAILYRLITSINQRVRPNTAVADIESERVLVLGGTLALAATISISGGAPSPGMITRAGLERLAAIAAGTSDQHITQISIGTGTTPPTDADTALVDQKSIKPATPSATTVDAAYSAPFTLADLGGIPALITEVGLHDAAGVLMARFVVDPHPLDAETVVMAATIAHANA